jgi:hypothetical protein
MIRLRSAIEDALGHRWLGPLIILTLAVLLVFVVLHTAHDEAHHDSLAFTCAAIAVLLTSLLVFPRRRILRVGLPRPLMRRGPPTGIVCVEPLAVPSPVSPPLRL